MGRCLVTGSPSWLDDLRPGDHVFRQSGRANELSLHQVERVTGRYVIVNGDKYRKRDGRETGEFGMWDVQPNLLQDTAETRGRFRAQRDEKARRQLAAQIDGLIAKQSLDTLRRIAAVIKAAS